MFMLECVLNPNADEGYSSHIEQLLGYCDSEHVVDSITLFA